MKKYGQDNGLIEIKCNQCGKKLKVENGLLKEAIFEANQNFGYFSMRDGFNHKFELCESCYNRLIDQFMIPVTETEQNEFFGI